MRFNAQLKILPLVSSHCSQLARWYASTPLSLKSSVREKNLEVKKLTKKYEDIQTITSIFIGFNYVSWAEISVPTLTLLDLNNYALDDFQNLGDKLAILKLAHGVVSELPRSDAYLMEDNPGKWIKQVNDYTLGIMLTVLLSLQSSNPNIIYQSPKVVNKLHKLLVDGERISATQILKEKIKLQLTGDVPQDGDGDSDGVGDGEGNNDDCYSSFNINQEQINSFTSCSCIEQDAFSLAILIALTFIDKNFTAPKP